MTKKKVLEERRRRRHDAHVVIVPRVSQSVNKNDGATSSVGEDFSIVPMTVHVLPPEYLTIVGRIRSQERHERHDFRECMKLISDKSRSRQSIMFIHLFTRSRKTTKTGRRVSCLTRKFSKRRNLTCIYCKNMNIVAIMQIYIACDIQCTIFQQLIK